MMAKIKSIIQSKYFGLAVVLILNFVFLSYFCVHKHIFFIDEGFSYGWANGSTEAMPIVSEDELCTYNPSVFNKQFTVQADEIWDYKQSMTNLFDQPPLYYSLLHVINLFFIDVFSKWAGLILNLIIFLSTQVVLYALSRQFLDVKKSLLVVVFYGFSLTAVCTTVFIRCYVLFTLLTTLLCLLTVKLLQAAENNENQKYNKILLCYFLTLFCGVLTHYYFLITAFSLCAGVCWFLLRDKMYKKLAVFASGSLVMSGLIPCLFSCVRKQFFSGDRSAELTSILHENFINHAFGIEVWNRFIKEDIFGNFFSGNCWLGLALLYGIYCLVKHRKINKSIIIFVITLIFTILVVSMVMPLNIRVSGTAKRYFFHITPLLALMLILCLEVFLVRFKKGFYVSVALVLGLLISIWQKPDFSVYFHRENSVEMFYARHLKNKTLWIHWGEKMPTWKLVEPALYSVYADRFIVFRNFSDNCFQNMWADRNARQYTALMIENPGQTARDCPKISWYIPVFWTSAICAYLPYRL